MALFDKGDPEEFLQFVQNFQITFEASQKLADNAKIQQLCTLLHDKALCQLDTLSAEVLSATTTHLNRIILVLGTYFPPIHAFSKQKCAMCRGMRKPRGLKLRRHDSHMIDINAYLDAFYGAKASDKIGETELDKIIQNSMLNR